MSVNSIEDEYDEHTHAIESGDEDPDHEHEQEDRLDQDGTRDELSEHDAAINDFLRPLSIDEPTLYQLACRFSKVYDELARTSDEQFLPTPVTSLPTGRETGRYLAIDVGGSNLRVAFIDLLGEAADASIDERGNEGAGTASPNRSKETLLKPRKHRVRRKYEKAWPIGEHLKMDKAEDLFLWIGDCMAEVVAERLSSDLADNGSSEIPEELEMGITFSFPMLQDSLSEATLMPMGKGFAITSDLNLGSILLAGYDRHTRRPYGGEEPSAKRRKRFSLPKLKIAAITNDTVATLASLAYLVKSLPNSRVAMGIIVGTGCNATIPMKLTDLHETKAAHVSSRHTDATETIINTEWTIQGAAPPLHELKITTKWDTELDEACARPGFQPFEYMTGGRYIGELVRIIFYDYLTTVMGLSSKALPANLVQPYALTTNFLSSVVAQNSTDARLVSNLKDDLPPPESSSWSWDIVTARAFRKVSRAVQTRSAGLIAAAVVGLLACTGELKLRHDGATNPRRSSNIIVPAFNGIDPYQPTTVLGNSASANSTAAASARENKSRTPDPRGDAAGTPPASWQSGPEELVVAYTGGIIQKYPNFKETCQQFIDRLVIWDGPQESGKSVFLREASDGGIIGAGVLAGMIAGR